LLNFPLTNSIKGRFYCRETKNIYQNNEAFSHCKWI